MVLADLFLTLVENKVTITYVYSCWLKIVLIVITLLIIITVRQINKGNTEKALQNSADCSQCIAIALVYFSS